MWSSLRNYFTIHSSDNHRFKFSNNSLLTTFVVLDWRNKFNVLVLLFNWLLLLFYLDALLALLTSAFSSTSSRSRTSCGALLVPARWSRGVKWICEFNAFLFLNYLSLLLRVVLAVIKSFNFHSYFLNCSRNLEWLFSGIYFLVQVSSEVHCVSVQVVSLFISVLFLLLVRDNHQNNNNRCYHKS